MAHKNPTRPMRGLESSLPLALLRARECAMNRFRPMLREHDLTEQQWRVIRVLAQHPSIEVTELAERAILLGPSVSRILQYLQQSSLIERSPVESDQRRSAISLSAKGRALFKEIAPHSEAIYSELEERFGRRRLASLLEMLRELELALSGSDQAA
ncbi:MAG: homoprotocatechuate degradation operon regulator HpaR [Pseudomonadota bacterium]